MHKDSAFVIVNSLSVAWTNTLAYFVIMMKPVLKYIYLFIMYRKWTAYIVHGKTIYLLFLFTFIGIEKYVSLLNNFWVCAISNYGFVIYYHCFEQTH
jgi:hypothetical protein